MTTVPGSPRSRRVDPIPEDECWERLGQAPVARFAYVLDGRPHVVPVNHTVSEGSIYVRTMPGAKLTITLNDLGAPVAIEVDGLDHVTHLGWSVLAHGAVYPVLDSESVAHLDHVGRPSWALGGEGGTWVRVDVESITGRRLVER